MSLRIGTGLGLIPTAARPSATTAPVNVVPPSFDGILTQGQSADVNPGAWTGLPSPNFAYAVKRGATTVSTDPAYVWTSADVAAGAGAMTVAVTATNDVDPTTATSDPVTIAAPLLLTGTAPDGIVGAAYNFTPTRTGGHAPFAFALTGTPDSGLDFSTSTGALTGAPVASGSAGLSIDVVDADGLTATLGPFDLAIANAPTLLPAPFYDDFGAPTGQINGRVRNGEAWEIEAISGTNFASLSVVTAGGLNGSLGAAPQNTYGSHKPAVDPVAEQWVKTRVKIGTTLTIHDNLTVPFGGAASFVSIANIVSGVGGIRFTPQVSGAAGATTTANNVPVRAGDTIGRRYYKVGANWLLDLHINGHKVYEGYDVTSKSVPVTFRHGFLGNLPTSGAAPGGVIDDFESGDPAARAMVWLDMAQRVANAKPNGDLVLKLAGRYSSSAPETLAYSLIDAATGAVVAGHDGVALSGLSAGAGTFEGLTANFAPADVPASFVIKLTRTGLAGEGEAYDYSPVLKKGRAFLTYGQSLIQQMVLATAGSTAAAPADGWIAQGSIDYNAAEYLRRTLPVVANTPTALLFKTVQDAQGAEPMCLVAAFRGGTKASERVPGSTHFTALLEGLARAGGDVAFMLNSAGTFDCASADRAIYAASENAIVDGVEDELGHTIKQILCPVGSIWNTSADDVEPLRYIQWKMTQDQPDRYLLGPYTMDLQHAAGDQYHLSNDAYGEQARRMGWAINQMDGVAASNRLGPKIVSVAKNSSSQITVTFDLNGASGLELVNTAYAADFRGGLRFAAASTFASPLSPTAATLGSVAGGQQTVTYDFAGTPFAGQAFVSGPYGNHPFNPENDTLIRADVAGKQSMLRGLFSGEPGIPVQPFYQTSGVNYVAS